MRPNQSSELMIARRAAVPSTRGPGGERTPPGAAPANPAAENENEKARLRDLTLARAARDDATAFTEIFERHAPPLRRWFRQRTGNQEVAADLTAETFAQAWKSLGRFNPRRRNASLGAWLQGIANNQLRHWQRHERVRTRARARLRLELVDSSGADALADVDARVSAELAAPELSAAMSSLSRATREAVEMRVVLGLSYEECAERLRCTEQAVRQRVSRGLGELKTTIEGEANGK